MTEAAPISPSAPAPPTLAPFIQNAASLELLVAQLQGAPRIALDTEFMREKTYLAELALLQLSDGSTPQLVDPLADMDLAPLMSCLMNPVCTKVLHAARQDLEVLLPLTGAPLAPVLDTQVAAALAGHAPQVGYGELVLKELGVALEKGQARTDWLRRPLSLAQAYYAADDVRYLLPLAGRLLARLGELGRLGWLAEETVALADPTLYTVDPAIAWQRLKGIESCPPREQARIRALAAWREARAQRRNLPRSWVLADDMLREVARRGPADLDALRELHVLQDKTLDKLGAELIEALAVGDAAPLEGLVQRMDTRPSATEKAMAQRLAATLKTAAEAVSIAPEVLATQRELRALARAAVGPEATPGQEPAGLPCLRGWRRGVVGEALLEACRVD